MENENVYQSVNGTTVIINGGNPLPGCPESWEQAQEIEKNLNGGLTKEEDDNRGMHPRWKFDCGFKLDYDGPLVSIGSRFYPPKTHSGATWDGSVTIFLFENEVADQQFDCPTLEELHKQVDAYVKGVAERVKEILGREKL